MIERKLFPILTLVEGVELGCPLDPDLVLVGDFDPYITVLVLVSFRVVAPNILSTELNARLYCGWPDDRDQRLNIDDSSNIQKPISLQVSEIVFGS